MNKNKLLKLKLWERGVSQEMLSKETGIPRTYISLAVNGRFLFDEEQKEKIAQALGLQKSEVFRR